MLPQLLVSELEVAIPNKMIMRRPIVMVAKPIMSYIRILPR
jgi:hypothetical protein